jgi:hypothetical protein
LTNLKIFSKKYWILLANYKQCLLTLRCPKDAEYLLKILAINGAGKPKGTQGSV